MELTPYLLQMVEKGASDLFISAGAPAMLKIDGEPQALDSSPLNEQQAHELIYSVLDDEQTKTFEATFELNMGLNLSDSIRFRINAYRQRGAPALVARHIKSYVPSLAELELPFKLQELIMEERGLLLVVGGTGTGKSTTVASMIDFRAKNKHGHILTVEDPIEFIHHHDKSLVNQREVGIDTLSYENALTNALRESPDVIMIGEIRDQATMQHALAYAETGHLCVSTLHANSADQALDRILNFFPDTAHQQILLDLSLHLCAIVSQRLAMSVNGGRIPAVEMLLNTPFISDLIQKGKVAKIKDAINQGKGRNGQTFDEALFALKKAEKITEHEALRLADSRNNLSLRFRLENGNLVTGAVKKDVVYDHGVSFEVYKTFTISPIKVDLSRRRDMRHIVSNAIAYHLTNKGLKQTKTSPDLDVQFVVGLKSKKGLSLQPIGDETDPVDSVSADSETHATLIINIVDTLKQKPVWRLTASTVLDSYQRSQEELNRDFAVVMENYPPPD